MAWASYGTPLHPFSNVGHPTCTGLRSKLSGYLLCEWVALAFQRADDQRAWENKEALTHFLSKCCCLIAQGTKPEDGKVRSLGWWCGKCSSCWWPLCYFLIRAKDLGWLALYCLHYRGIRLTTGIVYIRLRLCSSLSINKLAFWSGHWSSWGVWANLDTGWLLQTNSGAQSCRVIVHGHM